MTKSPSRTEHSYEFSGGRLCIDFVNTVSGDRQAGPTERMGSYADLLAWARQAGVLDAARARRLAAAARRRPERAEEAHARALSLRETLFRVFLAASEGGVPAEPDVEALSAEVVHGLSHRRLVRRAGGFALEWDDPPEALDAPLWRVALSASELLVAGADLERVRLCGLHETKECSWVFLDATRAHTRRWCSMKDCGNKAKARRHYERSREGG